MMHLSFIPCTYSLVLFLTRQESDGRQLQGPDTFCLNLCLCYQGRIARPTSSSFLPFSNFNFLDTHTPKYPRRTLCHHGKEQSLVCYRFLFSRLLLTFFLRPLYSILFKWVRSLLFQNPCSWPSSWTSGDPRAKLLCLEWIWLVDRCRT